MSTNSFRNKTQRRCGGLAAFTLVAGAVLMAPCASAETRLEIPPANVTASDSDSDINLPSNANDGSLATRWSAQAGGAGAQWLKYKLGGCYKVTRANLAWYRGDSIKYDFALQTSNDGNVWDDVFFGSNSGTTAALMPYDFGDKSTRYVRLQSTGNNVDNSVSLSEMEIWTNGTGDCGVRASGPVANPQFPPGGNFDFSTWQLTLPTGTQNRPDTIRMLQLIGGYSSLYFYTDSTDGALTFWCPENGVTWAESKHGRSELVERNRDDTGANWSSEGNHALSATLKVVKVPSNVTIGQIHIGAALRPGLISTTKPLVELYYHSNGDIVVGIENGPAGGQTAYKLDNVPLDTRFTYELKATGDTLTVSINGVPHTYAMPSSVIDYGKYFQAGAYIQSNSDRADVGALVKFYALRVTHD
jgi:hypothetical protein